MHHILDVLLGAALVAIGVLAAALADRVRGIRLAGSRTAGPRDRHPAAAESLREPAEAAQAQRPAVRRASRSESGAQSEANDVIAALVATGYKRPIATEAVWGCGAGERETIEGWTRAALTRAALRCARGAAS